MKKQLLLTLSILLSMVQLYAQETGASLYEGEMNDDMSITLFLKAEGNECNFDIHYSGMYKYNGVSNWLQLDATANGDTQFVFVEYGFTGVLILEKTEGGFDGIWISPDTKKQLKVSLKELKLNDEEREAYEDAYEEVNYENNDC